MVGSAKEFEAMRPDRWAGFFYLAIICLGIWSEGFVRGSLVVPGDAEQTFANISNAPFLFRLGILADIGMVLCDMVVALLLFALFRRVSRELALSAMIFRLMQAALIAASLLCAVFALLTIEQAKAMDGAEQMTLMHVAATSLLVHAHGYDIGLIFFGINCFITAILLRRSEAAPAVLNFAIILSGAVYIVGSLVRLLAPQMLEMLQPIYLVPLLAELAFALWLLRGKIGQAVLAQDVC